MWFEAVPSFAVVMACLTAPQIIIYATNRLFLGNAYKRQVDTYNDAHHFLRDMRISGVNDPYKQIGLDCIVVEEVVEEKAQCECK